MQRDSGVLLVHGIGLGVARGASVWRCSSRSRSAAPLADVGAFIVGRRFGRHAGYAAQLSPDKTREGLIGSTSWACSVLLAPAMTRAASARSSSRRHCVFVVRRGRVAVGRPPRSGRSARRGSRTRATGCRDSAGMLDRVDSLLPSLALAYWLARIGSLA